MIDQRREQCRPHGLQRVKHGAGLKAPSACRSSGSSGGLLYSFTVAIQERPIRNPGMIPAQEQAPRKTCAMRHRRLIMLGGMMAPMVARSGDERGGGSPACSRAFMVE